MLFGLRGGSHLEKQDAEMWGQYGGGAYTCSFDWSGNIQPVDLCLWERLFGYVSPKYLNCIRRSVVMISGGEVFL